VVDPKTPAVSLTEPAGMLPAAATSAGGPAIFGRSLKPSEVPAALRAPGRAAVTLADLDGDGALDAIDVRGGVLRVLKNDKGRFTDVTSAAGLAGLEARAAVAGDYDNDGRPDLLVLKPGALALFHNEGGGRFKDVTAAAQLPAYPYVTLSAAFVDIDHDGDLDVFVAGLLDLSATPDSGRPLAFPADFAPAPGLLLQNNGNGTFTDVTAKAKVGAVGHAIAVVPTDFDNRRDIDLLILRYDGPPLLLKNLRDGSFADVAAEVGLTARGPFLSVAAADLNKDGFTDFFLGTAQGPSLLALSDGRLGFKLQPAPEGTAGASAAQLVDYDADGMLDLVVATPAGFRVYRNTGGSFADVSTTAVAEAIRGADLSGAALAVADLDGDGDEDALLATPASLRYLRNDGGNANRSFALRLEGRVTNKGGVGAKVDIRAGSLRQKLESSAATPAAAPADLVFGLGKREGPDAIRVIWVSGVVQTETEFKPTAGGVRAALDVTELDRKPSSCPYLYAWNGERFAFLSDFLGGGEMGYWLGPGVRNVPDPEEYVRIRGDQLRAKDGRYELRVTNELEEVLYLDRLQLLAVAHPADVEVFPDEGMVEPAKAFRLLAVRDAVPPPVATDDQGRDVRDRVARLDRRFVDGFGLHRIRGYADEHALVLDLIGLPEDHTRLLLTGWTDYAFSSDNVAAHQAGLVMKPPALQVEDASGAWPTVVEDIGIPVGRPQTVVVDLAGKWRGPSRRVRVVTNMRIYWDEVRVGVPVDGRGLQAARVLPARAELAERLLGRGLARRPRALELRLRPGVPRVALEDHAGPLHPAGGRARAAGGERRRVRGVEAGGRGGGLLRRAEPAGPPEGLDPHLPPPRRRLQQGDGRQLGQPGRGPPPAVPRDDALSLRPARSPRASPARGREGRGLQHARGRAAASPDRARGGALTVEPLRYAAACCQTDLGNPIDRPGMRANTDRMLSMIDSALAGSAPFLPVRLVVFPEFAHAAPVFPTVKELLDKLAVPIPNEHTERLHGKAKEHGIYVQSGSFIEADPKYPGVVFNATCLIGPEGILYKYRKVNPWIPYEVHASPHEVAGYAEPLFPVAETAIGRIGCAICYDWIFPEALRQLAANGAEVLLRVSAYMDPWGATEPMDWWTVVNRCRALENIAYVVAANQGAALRRYPPYSWPGGSMVVDYDGRILAQASPGPGERIVVAPVDITALRHERSVRRGHHMLAHLRTEAYPVYRGHVYPPEGRKGALSYEENNARIDEAKKRFP
jgi:formamidase